MHGEGMLTHTHIACLKDTVWGAFLINSSYSVCKTVLLFGGIGDRVPHHCLTTDVMWYLLAAVEMSLMLMFDGECDSLSC